MNRSLQEAIELRRSKGQSDAEIVDYLLKRSDRKEENLTYYKKRTSELKEALIQAQFESGRRVRVTVDNIIRTGWGNYLYHKNTRYRYDGKVKAWVKDTNKNSLMQHHMENLPGKFHVELILSDEDMPKKYTGICSGELGGKKIILSPDSFVNYGDVFVMYKQEKKNA